MEMMLWNIGLSVIVAVMGFFLKLLTHTIQLHPQFFGPQMRAYLTKRLYEEVEGTCSGRFGYITPDTYPVYGSATAAEKAAGSWIVDEGTLLFPDGTGPYRII